MQQVDERYLTLQEVADRLRVNYRTVYRWVRAGDLAAIQFGREYRITESDLKDFLDRRRTRPEC